MTRPTAQSPPSDQATADAFASSWNHLPAGSVYTRAQFEEWLAPLARADVEGRRVLELGCGNGSLLVHMADWRPAQLEGVDLGDSVRSAERNMRATGFDAYRVVQRDLLAQPGGEPFDLVYCIGVLHHLRSPARGFDAMLRQLRPGGRFHGWVYAHEGNAPVRLLVEPMRRVTSRLPWWLTKYAVATPLALAFYGYAQAVSRLDADLPLAGYCRWIAPRELGFFRHVAFDQLVTPQTAFLRRAEIERWLADPRIEPGSIYLEHRNGNGWKFGGRVVR